MKKLTGIAGRLTMGVILFGILLGVVCITVGYLEFTTVLEQQYNDSAYEIAETARAFLNPDKFEQYLETGQTDEEYESILAELDALTDATNVTFIYVAKVSEDYKTLTYIYDTVNSGTGFSRYPLGYTASDLDEQYTENVMKIMTQGGRAEKYLYTYSKESGAHTTAAIDVKNSNGDIIAMLCVEKPMTRLVAARNTYALHVVLWTLVLMLLFIFGYTVILRRHVIKPILTVTDEAKRFAETNTPSSHLQSIKQKDEIGILARAVGKMEHDIAEYTENLTAITAEKERVNTELSVATRIQANMLPSIFPPFPERKEIDIFAMMHPAKEVGGDFYDFFMVDDRHLAIVMADVSGKGVPAALFMVIGKTLIKDHTQPGKDLGEVFSEVNSLLCESNSEGLFITAFEGVLDLVTGEFRYVNAGHEIPFVCKKGEGFRPYRIRAGFVLAGMEGIHYKCGSIQLEPGDKIFQYTDGVTEATNQHNELYGIKRLEKVLDGNKDCTPAELLPRIKEDVEQFVGEAPQFDDITMLCMEFKHRMNEDVAKE